MELPRNRDEILILYLDTSVNLIRWKKVEELVSIFQSVFGSSFLPSPISISAAFSCRRND